MDWPFRLQREIGRAMSGHQYRGKDGKRYRVPIEQPHVSAHSEIRKERHRKIAVCIKRNASRQVTRRCTKKDRKEEIRNRENKIPEPLPKTILDMAAYFDGYTTENQAPQNQKQCEVVAGKRRSHEPRKDGKQC